MLLEVLHQFVDDLASLKALTGSRQAELHEMVEKIPAYLEQIIGDVTGQQAEVPDVPAGA